MESTRRRLLAQLLVERLGESHETGPLADDARREGLFSVQIDGEMVTVVVDRLAANAPDTRWQETLRTSGDRIDTTSPGAVLLWLPPGAELPAEEPAQSAAVATIQEVVSSLGPGDAAEVAIPITIGVHKRDESGNYVSAFGGLAPLWARFTERVHGYFIVDSTRLHRLPAGDSDANNLIDRIVKVTEGLAAGETQTVIASDFWHVQRLRGGAGCTILGLPPDDESEMAAPLRRRVRAVLRDATERAAGLSGTKVLLLGGHYASLEGEPVGPALLGQDPALVSGLDLVALVANGQVKPLLDVSRRPALALRRPSA